MHKKELDFDELISHLWLGKWRIVIVTFIFAMFGVFYALSLPNIYKSEALLLYNNGHNAGSGITLPSQLGGLASLAGINIGAAGNDKKDYALAYVQSRKFLIDFINENNLKQSIMAAKDWDQKANRLILDPDLYDEQSDKWIRDVKFPYKPEPSDLETYEQFLKENLSISIDKQNGMVKLAVSHYSPYVAKEITQSLVQTLNRTIQQQDLRESEESIRYLESELQSTDLADMRSMFYQLIEKQQQKLMLTKVRYDYVFKVVDDPVVMEKKDRPSRALVVIVITFLGGIFSLLTILVPVYSKQFK